jgi:zinc protease
VARFQHLIPALALVGLFGAGPEVTSAQRATSFLARDTVLSNGLAIIAVRNPTIPAVTVEVAFRNGSFTQLEEKDEGLPHLMEHMLFRAYSGGSWSRRVGELDGTYNGTTGVETVTYYLIVPRENVEGAIELIARLVSGPRFSPSDLADEKEVVRNEIARLATDPFYLLDLFTDRSLYGTSFRQKNPSGTVLSILDVSTDDLRAHHRRFYVPNNAALVVTGDISHDEVFSAAREHMGSWERADDPFEGLNIPPVPRLARDTAVLLEAEVPDVTFTIAWQGPSESEDPDAAVAANVFGEMVNQRVSEAHRRLVDSGLFHFVSFTHQPSNRVGALKLTARTIPESVARASRTLRQEILLMENENYLSEEELEKAITSLQVLAAFQRESAISLAHALARRWSLVGMDHYADGLLMEREISLADIQSLVARYIAGEPRALTVMVSDETIRRHRGALLTAINLLRMR